MENSQKKLLLDSAAVAESIGRLADQILEDYPKDRLPDTVLLGLQIGGVPLARRLGRIIREKTGVEVPLGTLDIAMYRDDFGTRKSLPLIRETEIPFNITGKIIILTDGVIQTGRSVRAALDAVTDYGRPAIIRLAVLIDRGGREYPIAPDYVAHRCRVAPGNRVRVEWCEYNQNDAAYEAGAAQQTEGR